MEWLTLCLVTHWGFVCFLSLSKEKVGEGANPSSFLDSTQLFKETLRRLKVAARRFIIANFIKSWEITSLQKFSALSLFRVGKCF